MSASPALAPPAARTVRSVLVVGFFLTGFTALAAEVILSRLLGYVFGSSHEATATALAAYMSGLSVGAYAFGRWATRLRRPVFTYAILELVVALFYCAIPTAYLGFRGLGIHVATALAGHPVALTAARFSLSFLFVFGPTLLMGGTLPVLMSATIGRDRLRSQLPVLYGANTLGAALGALSASYRLIPSMGLEGTLASCALVNLLVSGAAFLLSTRLERTAASAPMQQEGSDPVQPASDPDGPWLPLRAVLFLAFGQGVLVFVLEVLWTHLIGTVIGVTAHAFAVMLTAILLGIGAGSAAIPAVRRRLGLSPLGLFVAAEAGLAVAMAASLPFWDRFPLVINLSLELKPVWSFAERELVRFAFALLLLLPATLCIGLALPSLIAAGRPEEIENRLTSRWVGATLAANTLGAIVGSVLCGFVLLGRVGSPAIILGASTGGLLLAGVTLVLARGRRPLSGGVMLGATALVLLVGFASPGWDRLRLTAGTHVYWTAWSPRESGELVFFAEDAKIGFVTVKRRPNGTLVMETNGKYESSNGAGEFQDMLAALAGLYARDFHRAFLLGLGGGRNLALLREMPFEHVEVAEFSPTVVLAARTYFPDNVGRDSDPRARIVVDDGRSRLQTLTDPLDVAIVAISSAAYAGSGNLYNRDFFGVVASRLGPRGIFVFWLQFHHLREPAIRSVIHTLRLVFPHVHLYASASGGQGFLVASRAPLVIDPGRARSLSDGPRMRTLLSGLGFPSLTGFTSFNVFSTDAELEAYIGSPRPRVYHDLDPAFEYAASEGLAEPLRGLDLQPRSTHALPAFDPPLAEAEAEGLRGLRLMIAGDRADALAHLQRAEALLGEPAWQRQIQELSRSAPPAPGSISAPGSP